MNESCQPSLRERTNINLGPKSFCFTRLPTTVSVPSVQISWYTGIIVT